MHEQKRTIQRRKNGRAKTTDNPNAAGRPAGSPLERFNKSYQVNPETACWEWTGHRDSKGYGVIWNGDKTDNRPENLEIMTNSTHTSLHNSANKLGFFEVKL